MKNKNLNLDSLDEVKIEIVAKEMHGNGFNDYSSEKANVEKFLKEISL